MENRDIGTPSLLRFVLVIRIRRLKWKCNEPGSRLQGQGRSTNAHLGHQSGIYNSQVTFAPRPLSPLPVCGERGTEGAVRALVRGFHPRLLNLLPSGEHGFSPGRPSPLQSGTEGFETASTPPMRWAAGCSACCYGTTGRRTDEGCSLS